MFTRLARNHAQKVLGIRVIGFDREYPAIDCFGFLQAAGPGMRPARVNRRRHGLPVYDVYVIHHVPTEVFANLTNPRDRNRTIR